MTTLVFTICARNYIGLSRVLQQSVARHGKDVAFRIYVADGLDGLSEEDRSDDRIMAAPIALLPFINASEFLNMAFMYNVTEFCTSLKAACFMHGFADGYDKCLYMDPDIFIVENFDHIALALDDCSILITPHLCRPVIGEGPRRDCGILATGVYNLGFLGLHRSDEAESFLHWWHERLRRQAFNDHYNALYTDQRWIDFVPSLFSADSVCIWRHLGCNVAPWNYHERRIEANGSAFTVHSRRAEDGRGDDTGGVPLLFLHFSGFDFRRILHGEFNQLNLADAEDYADLLPVYDRYGREIRSLAEQMARYLALPYGFEQFNDGSTILPSHRRLFRVWRERHGDAMDPFATGKGTFHAALVARGLLGKPGAATNMRADKATLREVTGSEKLVAWAQRIFHAVFRVLGRSRFFFLIRALNRFANVEQHYDTFRLDDAQITTAKQPKHAGNAR